ncbi:unnamed protein product [Gadus morhua 'NCC']
MEEQMSGIWCPCQKGGERGMEKDGVPFEQQAWRKSSRPQSEPCQRGREPSSPQHLPPQVPGRPRPQRSELIVPPCVL